MLYKNITFLGINLDSNLTWKSHINALCKKISRGIYMMNKLKNTLPLKALKTLYFTLVESYLNYGLIAWGNSSHISKVFMLQKRAIRIINRKPYRHHTEPLFKSLQILKLEDLYHLQILLFMNDLQNDNLPTSFRNFATLNINLLNRTTRQSNLYHTSLPRTLFSSKLPNHTFPKIWNNYSRNLTLLGNRSITKKHCKSFFLSRYLDIVN